MYPARSDLHPHKMSVAHLEQLVSCIVRGSCGNGANPERAKPKRWSRDVPFSYPLTRARTTDSAKWRETLLNVVARCTKRGKDCVLRKPKLPPRSRNKSTDSRSSKTSDENINDNVCYDKPQDRYSSVVRLDDMKKKKDKEVVNKNNFLNYFKLSDTQNCSVIVNRNAYKNKNHHSVHLLNSQSVPFSSDLGQRLTKECHIVSEEIHQRKIERVERYLTTVINTDTAKLVEYEVSFNKQPHYSHTYVFPNKTYKRRDRISSKATFILMNYCKPCSVKLEKLQINLDKNIKTNKNNVPDSNDAQKVKKCLPQKEILKENLPLPTSPEDICIRDKTTVLETLLHEHKKTVLQQNNQQYDIKSPISLSPVQNILDINSKMSKKKNNNNKRRKLKLKMKRLKKKKVFFYETRRTTRVSRLRCVNNKK